jgi:organic hydroperoxide reductase OsmC/OhrA
VSREHHYRVEVEWTGNRGSGTSDYRAYERAHEVRREGKPTLSASSDASMRGDGARWNPEELLVAALSQCHMLWYLHLCSVSDVVVESYVDRPEGTMAQADDLSGRFTQVTLRPSISIADAERLDRARELHVNAHRMCFIANSVNFPVTVEPDFER